MSVTAGAWRQGGGIGGRKEVLTGFDPQLAAEQAVAVRRARGSEIRAITAGVLDPQDEAALIFDMLRDQRTSAGILPSGVNGTYPGETPMDRLHNGAVIYAADEHFRGRTGESTDEIMHRWDVGDTDLRDIPFEMIEGLVGVAAITHAPMFLAGLAAPLGLDALKATLSGTTLERARDLAWLDVAPRLVKIVNGMTALAIAASGLGVGGGVVKKLVEGDHPSPDGKPPIKALGFLAAASAFLTACREWLSGDTPQPPTIEVTKLVNATATHSTDSGQAPKASETPTATLAPTSTLTATETLISPPTEIPYGLDGWIPASGGEGTSLVPLSVPERALIDSHSENANYQLLIARVNRGAGEERVTGFRQCLSDGFCFSSVAAIDLAGDTDILGPDGKWYRMDTERSQNGVIRYGLADGQTADQQEMEMVFVNVFRDADAMARRADGALVPVKIGTDGRISEFSNEPNHFFFVPTGTSATVDLDAPGGRFVRIDAPADQGGGTIWLDIVSAESTETPSFIPTLSLDPTRTLEPATVTPQPSPEATTEPSSWGPDARQTGTGVLANGSTIALCTEPDGTRVGRMSSDMIWMESMPTHVIRAQDGVVIIKTLDGEAVLPNAPLRFIKQSGEQVSGSFNDLKFGDCLRVNFRDNIAVDIAALW